MADVQIQNNPPPQQPPPPVDGGRGSGGLILAIVLVVALLLVAWVLFGRGDAEAPDVNVEVPSADAPTVEVPEKVDVNVKTDATP